MKLTKHLGRGGAAAAAGAVAPSSSTEITITAVDIPGGTTIPWTEFWVDYSLGEFGTYGPSSGATVEEWRAYVIAGGMPDFFADDKIYYFYQDAAMFGYSLQTNAGGVTDTVTITVNGTPDPNIYINWGDSSSSNASDFTGSVISHTYSGISGNDTRDISVLGENEFLVDFGGTLELTNWGANPWYSGEYLAKFVSSIGTFSETNTPTFKDTGVVKFGHSTVSGAYGASPDVTNWDVSNVTDLSYAFLGCDTFNQDISGWDVSNVTSLRAVFKGCSVFNQPLNSWNTANVTDMAYAFDCSGTQAAFNQPLNSWNTANVTDMSYMFYFAKAFNQPINTWDTSNVVSFKRMFFEADGFLQPLNSWNTANVTNMDYMFKGVPYNQPLNSWNTTSVTSMRSMFAYSSQFNQNIRMWNFTGTPDFYRMFYLATAMQNNQGAPETPTIAYFNE